MSIDNVTCTSCLQTITDRYIYQVAGTSWHETCLICHQCKQILPHLGATLYVGFGGRPLCYQCYIATQCTPHQAVDLRTEETMQHYHYPAAEAPMVAPLAAVIRGGQRSNNPGKCTLCGSQAPLNTQGECASCQIERRMFANYWNDRSMRRQAKLALSCN